MASVDDATDAALAELNAEVARIVTDLSPFMRRRHRRFAEAWLHDRVSQLMHRSVRAGAKLVGELRGSP